MANTNRSETRLGALLLGLALAACGSAAPQRVAALDPSNPDAPESAESPAAKPVAGTVYTCPMHPEVISDQPGRCPKCGMKLLPKGEK